MNENEKALIRKAGEDLRRKIENTPHPYVIVRYFKDNEIIEETIRWGSEKETTTIPCNLG